MSIFLARVFFLLYSTTMISYGFTNTTFYRSHKKFDVIIAGGSKNLVSFKRAKNLKYIIIHNNDRQTSNRYPDLHIIVRGDKNFKLRLSDLKLEDLKMFKVNNSESRYIPSDYPKNAKQYDFEGVSVILNDDNKFLGARILGSKDNRYYLARAGNVKKIPMTISDMKILFGEGEVYNAFIH